MHRIFYWGSLLFIILGTMISCTDSDNNKENLNTTFGNANQLPGNWIVTAKYLEIIPEEGDKLQDSEADIIKPMNAIFNNWIKNGEIQLNYGALSPFINDQEGGSRDETIYLNNLFQKTTRGSYYVQSNNEDVTTEITTTEAQGGVWISTAKIGVFGSSFYMRQKLTKSDLNLLWKVYGDGNREFFSTDQVTMVIRAKRVY